MTKKKECTLKLIGRVLLSVIFILAGFGKIGAFAGTAGYVASVGIPMAELVTVLVIILELGGGLLLLVGFKTRIVAFLLAIFTILAALLFHNNFSDQTQMSIFLKNLAIAGGLFYVKATGAGSYSVDAKMKKEV